MIKSVFTVLDEKAKVIGPLFLASSFEEAKRTVSMSITPDSLPGRYPADFALMCLEDIAIESGAMSRKSEYPVLVCKLDEIIEVK